jgi:Kef-type K+ transport system membrane component KefB
VNVLITVGLAIALAFLTGKIVNKLKIPMVTGFVLIGVILGISVLKIFSPADLSRASLIGDLALGIIAFEIGAALEYKALKSLGKNIISISVAESLGAFLLVVPIVLVLGYKLYAALILGAVASATAPAATVAVLNQYKARGPLTTALLAVVGIDDGIALIIYGFAAAIAKSLISSSSINIQEMIWVPLGEIMTSFFIGIFSGLILAGAFRKLKDKTDLLAAAAAAILLCSGIAIHLHVSQLLAVMTLGVTLTNVCEHDKTQEVTEVVNLIGFPIIAAFFCLAGARLRIDLIPRIGLIAIAYTAARMIGKYSGASLGARISKAPEAVRKYIGLGLWPQIGVAVALAIIIGREFGHQGLAGRNLATLVINVLLFTTIITEIVGPLTTKWAITQAGEAGKA